MKLIINNLRQYLKSSKAVFLFNIAGFTVAFTAFLVIAIQVNYDFGYNRHFTKSGEIYRFNRYNHGNGDAYRTINQDWARDMQAKIPEVKAYCLLSSERTVEIATETDGVRREYAIPFMEATPGFFDVFTPETVSGSVEKIFDADGKALISEKTAEK
ncbi:MAG: hypothetical protein LBH72_02885, partial [Proteiniphilum sp.]|nr:hypothetical protein [Proteiniphilum sp.]